VPFKLMSDIAKNEQIVKLIFDNLRNVGICAIIAGAANWSQKVPGSQLNSYFAVGTSWILYAVAFCLFFINMESGFHRLRSLKAPRWVLALLGAVYGVAIGNVFHYLIRSH
jgi:hypothetical protein